MATETANKNIDQIIVDIDKYFSKHKYWMSRILSRETKRGAFFYAIFISFGLFIIGLIFSAIYFKGAPFSSLSFNDLSINSISLNNIFSYMDLTTHEYALELAFMPFFLLVHLTLLYAMGRETKNIFLVAPKMVKIPEKDLKSSMKWMRSNIIPLLIALPFILYDSYYANYGSSIVIFNPVVRLIVVLSWIIEWLIYGIIIYGMVYYLFFIRKVLMKYKYEENIFSIVVNGESNDLTRLGYKNSFIFGAFILINIIYMIATGYWLSDMVALLLMLILLPIITIVPLQLVDMGIKKEKETVIKTMTDRYVSEGVKFLANPDTVSVETKMNFYVTKSILDSLQEYHESRWRVYLRLVYIIGASLIGLVIQFKSQLLPVINNIFHTNIVFFILNTFPFIFH